MHKYLGAKFWISVSCFLLLTAIVVQGPQFFWPTVQVLTFSDEVRLGSARSAPILASSGLTPDVAERLTQFMTDLAAQPHAPKRWSKLNRAWLAQARHWFEASFPGEERFNRYTSLWVGKREKTKLWRLNCRDEFFPDMNDEELLARAQWIHEQEEWQEMQAKITRGLTAIDSEYAAAIKELMGDKFLEFEKLHYDFVKENLPKHSSSTSYFL